MQSNENIFLGIHANGRKLGKDTSFKYLEQLSKTMDQNWRFFEGLNQPLQLWQNGSHFKGMKHILRIKGETGALLSHILSVCLWVDLDSRVKDHKDLKDRAT